jgi:uncharacterized FlaG/YvyC family protein
MPGNNENTIAAIGGKNVSNRIPQMDAIEKTMQEQKSEITKENEKVDRKVVSAEELFNSEKPDLKEMIDRKRFYNVQFDGSLSKLFTEVIDRETDNVVLRIPAWYSESSYTNSKKNE